MSNKARKRVNAAMRDAVKRQRRPQGAPHLRSIARDAAVLRARQREAATLAGLLGLNFTGQDLMNVRPRRGPTIEDLDRLMGETGGAN